MQSVTGKEQTMKARATHKLIQLAAVLGAAGSVAAVAGGFAWSDATVKREVAPVEGAVARLRTL